VTVVVIFMKTYYVMHDSRTSFKAGASPTPAVPRPALRPGAPAEIPAWVADAPAAPLPGVESAGFALGRGTTYGRWCSGTHQSGFAALAIPLREPMTDRSKMKVRRAHVRDADPSDERVLSAEERLALVWPLTVSAWAFRGISVADSDRLRRDVVRVIRRGR
jgi:hypothetical protein